jgi:hypothetical protein
MNTTHPAAPDTGDLPLAYREIAEEVAVTLGRAADELIRRGMYRGYFRNPEVGFRPAGPVDARGAINTVEYGDPEYCGTEGSRGDRVALALLDHLGLTVVLGGLDHDDQQGIVSTLADWGDDPKRSVDDVAAAMRSCATELRALAIQATALDAEQADADQG